MSVEIIAIGDEILSGMTANTNATWISEQLTRAGWHVERHTVLPDDREALESGLREALSRSHLVITTGGLGPTCDDLTRAIAAKIFDSPLQRDNALFEELKQRYGTMSASLEHQALVPTKAKRLPNFIGTASGLFFSEKGHSLALLPGPPREMMPMLAEILIPQLPKLLGKEPTAPYIQTAHLCFLREDEVDPLLRKLEEEYPDVHIGIYPGYGVVTVRFYGTSEKHVRLCWERVKRDFGTYLFEATHGKIEESIHEWFKNSGKTLAFAESCTGGKMASLITMLSGASEFFLGSLVTYSNSMKRDLLGVSEGTLQDFGAVSKEVVQEMLAGVFKTTGADYGVAVSGIAGPTGGTPEKPVGTVWAAIGERGKSCDCVHMFLPFNRETIITVTSARLLGGLLRKIGFGIPFRSEK